MGAHGRDALPASPTTASPAAVAPVPAARPILLRASFIHGDSPTSDLRFVQALDGRLGLVGDGHFDEGETAGAAGLSILDDAHGRNFAVSANASRISSSVAL